MLIGEFPNRVTLTAGKLAVGWREIHVRHWINREPLPSMQHTRTKRLGNFAMKGVSHAEVKAAAKARKAGAK